MIGRLQGILLEKQAPYLLVDIKGVGYEVEAPMTTFYRLPEVGEEVILHTHFVVREDAQLLYGFYQQSDRTLFRALIKVNGIGPKLALTILSGMEIELFIKSIQNKDVDTLTRLPGVGKKTAERLVIEMADRLKDWRSTQSNTIKDSIGDIIKDIQTSSASKLFQEAVSALIALGYKPQEASRMVAEIEEQGLGSEEMIRRALKRAVSA